MPEPSNDNPPAFQRPPKSRQVCHCLGVSESTIVSVIHEGYNTVLGVAQTTRAGTGCGGCRENIRRLIEANPIGRGKYGDR